MRKILILFIFFTTISIKSQTDTSGAFYLLDLLTPEELLQHYIDEQEPTSLFKGPEKVGDSLFTDLNSLTIPTQTVLADNLYNEEDELKKLKLSTEDSINNSEQKLKPKIAIGMGRLGFHGDLYEKHFQSPLTARSAYDLNISQRLTHSLQLNFNILFGKLGANEYTANRNENFQSEIRAGGLSLMYDFGNIIPETAKARPYLSLGVSSFEFLSKTDLRDKDGKLYYYWKDGSIKDMPEGSANAQFANNLIRDYYYETDIRERNLDGFGKYSENAWAFPIAAGAILKITDRIDLKLNFQYNFTTTDYIDGISNKSIGNRAGNSQKDNFSYMSFALQYDLITKPRQKSRKDTLNNEFWLAFDNEDRDGDGVTDLLDDCQGTPEGVQVDAKGCPLDDDKDGIPNYRDDELSTPLGMPVNDRGVSQTDDYWAAWYDQYLNDSTGIGKTTEYIGDVFGLRKKNAALGLDKDLFTVELARYTGSIPNQELIKLLSIGDVSSTTLDDGTTVVYTSGTFDKVSKSIKRRDDLRKYGIKGADVSKIRAGVITKLTQEEIDELLKNELSESNIANADANKDSNENNTAGNSSGKNNKGKNKNKKNSESDDSNDEESLSGIVYRVQLGAYKNKVSASIFNIGSKVIELKAEENLYRYVTKGYKTIDEAAKSKADLILKGYSDVFITAYKDGKRLALAKTSATVEKNFKEDLNEPKAFSSIDKKLVIFKVQLGSLKKPSQEKISDDLFKEIQNLEKQTTVSGSIRYIVGSFESFASAESFRKELEEKGFLDAFIIATFKNEIISIQEANDLMK